MPMGTALIFVCGTWIDDDWWIRFLTISQIVGIFFSCDETYGDAVMACRDRIVASSSHAYMSALNTLLLWKDATGDEQRADDATSTIGAVAIEAK